MAADLASRRCEACEAGTPPLAEAEAAELHGQLDPAWSRDGNRSIRRKLAFRNFQDAFGFATRVALLAESEGHHPDLEVSWGRVIVKLTTHSAGGLTAKDFKLASLIEKP